MAETNATEEPLTFAHLETWEIAFEAQDANGVRIPPADIAEAEFRLDRRGARELTLTLGDGIEPDGNSPENFLITVSRTDQVGGAVAADVHDYSIWIRLQGATWSRQVFGTIHAER